MNNRGNGSSWALFVMIIGMLFIMGSPQSEVPAIMIIGGIIIIIGGVIAWRRSRRGR